MRIRPAVVPLLVPLAAALALLPGAAFADGAATTDPTGDAHVGPLMATDNQVDAADITDVSYKVKNGVLFVRTDVVRLSKVQGYVYVETLVRGGGSHLTLSTQIGTTKVNVFDGDHLYVCRGSSASVKGSQVRQRVPVDCLVKAERATFQSFTTVADAASTPYARDHSDVVGPLPIG